MSKRWDGDDLIEFPSSARDDLRPMSEFDPTSRALVYDEMNDTFLEWQPDWAESYRDQTKELDHRGYPNWDGLILTGWLPADYSPGKGAIPT